MIFVFDGRVQNLHGKGEKLQRGEKSVVEICYYIIMSEKQRNYRKKYYEEIPENLREIIPLRRADKVNGKSGFRLLVLQKMILADKISVASALEQFEEGEYSLENIFESNKLNQVVGEVAGILNRTYSGLSGVVSESILIHAPVEKVFEFMAKPENLPRIWPSLQEVRNVQLLPNGGYCYDWTYKMAGIHFDGKAEWSEFVKNERIFDKNESSINSTFLWSFQPKEGGTQVTLNVEYIIPGTITSKLAEPIIHKMNEHEASTVLANLKAWMEG